MAKTPELDLRENYGKNYIINGNFDFWQRNTTFTPSNGVYVYTADRFAATSSGGNNITLTRQTAGGVNLPGSTYFMRVTANTTVARLNNLLQALEAPIVDAIKGKTMTFSVKLRISSGSPRQYRLQVNKNSSANAGPNTAGWTNIVNTTVVPTTTFATYSTTFTVPTDGTANGLYVSIDDLGNGSVGTTGDYVDIAQVMLTEGNNAIPDFRTFSNGDTAGELAACLRYYQKTPYVTAIANATTSMVAYVPLTPIMRSGTAAIAQTGVLNAQNGVYNQTQSAVSLSVSLAGPDGYAVTCGNFTGLTTGNAYYLGVTGNNSNCITVDIEL
jgi:hypothetical protein